MLINDEIFRCTKDDIAAVDRIDCHEIYDKGSVLILVVVIVAVITSLGLVTINVSLSQLQIKKANSNIKRSLYLSEDGLNYSYLKVYDLVSEACVDSLIKADAYLLSNPDDSNGAKNLFKNNIKIYVINKGVHRVNSNDNPNIQVLNYNNLILINDKITIRVKSKYISDIGIEKSSTVDIIASVPDYFDVKAGDIDIFDFLYMDCFDI